MERKACHIVLYWWSRDHCVRTSNMYVVAAHMRCLIILNTSEMKRRGRGRV